MIALKVARVGPNKQTHPTWWAFLSNFSLYKFEIISAL